MEGLANPAWPSGLVGLGLGPETLIFMMRGNKFKFENYLYNKKHNKQHHKTSKNHTKLQEETSNLEKLFKNKKGY